jgi:DNA polymerase elongation subunit (family B)
MLSPFNKIDEREVRANFGQMQTVYNFVGMPHLDYMQIYKKHTYTPRESYRLDFIGHAELGEEKLTYDDYGDLQDLYEKNYQLFIDYNIRDVDIIKRLDEKLGLMSLIYAMSYYSLCNFEDTMGTVKIWEKLVAKFLYSKNVVPPFRREKIIEEREFEGAYIKEPIKGFHDWVVSYDLNSLYPHIEQQWNIGPETHVPINIFKEKALEEINERLKDFD